MTEIFVLDSETILRRSPTGDWLLQALSLDGIPVYSEPLSVHTVEHLLLFLGMTIAEKGMATV
ncbi:MAG: hypothetical protein ACRD22_07990 [Terriglobia bacterium]